MHTTTIKNDSSNRSAALSQSQHGELGAGEAAWLHLREYAKEHPETVALWIFGVGFVLGWKLKPW